MARRTLLVISARLDDDARAAVAAGRWPRKDFFELQRALDADVLDYATVESRLMWRLLRRVAGVHRAQAWIAFTHRRRYGRIFTDGEHVGLPLAVLLRFDPHRPRHVTLGHLLTTPVKRFFFRRLHAIDGLDRVLVHGALQRRLAIEQLSLPPARVGLTPYQIDPDFWTAAPAPPDEPPLICAVGLEYRDYPTLLAAVRGLPVRVVIAAGSRWSTHRFTADGDALPDNVEVTTLDYVALRTLYRRARFVVVPLREVDNPAGITVILEAMAMSKALIVSATRGQRDTLRGRLCTANGPDTPPIGGPAAFGVTGEAAEAETGLYVPPGDVAALRRAIGYLLDHPDECVRMGAAGRRMVESHMSIDAFVARIAAELGTGPTPSPQSTEIRGMPARSARAPRGAVHGKRGREMEGAIRTDRSISARSLG